MPNKHINSTTVASFRGSLFDPHPSLSLPPNCLFTLCGLLSFAKKKYVITLPLFLSPPRLPSLTRLLFVYVGCACVPAFIKCEKKIQRCHHSMRQIGGMGESADAARRYEGWEGQLGAERVLLRRCHTW